MRSLFDPLEHIEAPQQLTLAQVRQLTKYELERAALEAARLLRRAVRDNSDYTGVQIRAALGVLDRTGFGPQSSMIVDDAKADVTHLSTQQLRDRAEMISRELLGRANDGEDLDDALVSVH